MANNPEIQVEIGANITGLQKGVAGAEATLKQVGNAANQAAPQVQKLANATSQYNSVGIDFARIIQDAPFGIIGVGNNITQLAGSFQNLKNQTGSASSAIKAGFASIFSSGNLLVLGISAVTTALTLYSQSAQGAKGPIDDLKEAQDNYNDSLKETDRLLGKEVFATFLKEVGLIEKQNIGGRLIDVPTFENATEVVDKLGGKIESLRKGELELLAKFFQTEIAEALRVVSNNTNELGVALAQQDLPLYQGLLDQVNKQLGFYKTNTEKSTKATKELKEEIFAFSTNPLVDAYFEAIRVGAQFEDSLKKAASGLTGLEGQDPEIINFGFALPDEKLFVEKAVQLKEFSDFYKQVQEQTSQTSQILVDSFSALGNQIAASLNIGNDALQGFVATLLSNTPKIIQAIFQQAAAKKLAAKVENQAQAQIAAGEGIVIATKAASKLGPVGLAVLPVLIGGALALISSAFRKTGSGGGGVGSVGTSGVGSGISFSGAGATAGSFNRDLALTGEFTIRGTDLVYVIDRSKERISKG